MPANSQEMHVIRAWAAAFEEIEPSRPKGRSCIHFHNFRTVSDGEINARRMPYRAISALYCVPRTRRMHVRRARHGDTVRSMRHARKTLARREAAAGDLVDRRNHGPLHAAAASDVDGF
jgi:hypothetical protein